MTGRPECPLFVLNCKLMVPPIHPALKFSLVDPAHPRREAKAWKQVLKFTGAVALWAMLAPA